MFQKKKNPSRNLEKYPSPPISAHVSTGLGRLRQRAAAGGPRARPGEEGARAAAETRSPNPAPGAAPRAAGGPGRGWQPRLWLPAPTRAPPLELVPCSSVLLCRNEPGGSALPQPAPGPGSPGAGTSSACTRAPWGSPWSLGVPNPGQESWRCPEGSRRADATFVLLIKLLE